MKTINFIFLIFLILFQIHQILKNYHLYKKTNARKNKNLVWIMVFTLLITCTAVLALIFDI
ncbi:hypothetical protein L4932_13560 [Staphylococcus aureus]|uniref:AclI n=1 Tax=Staphylococcus aureus TaxID=1280 RepID=X4YJ57_STAAU|nr:hypothetical protein [Staphylococcus aureus]AHV78696.1 AclI [Staphylococcus aureus]ATV90643.1 AclI [Staphylococcus aureus]MDN4125451.1 hypothetical protein [Staphylococcus aureus]PCF67958.1 hypothetical protein CKO30_14635 [Staphylococcus aureus]